MFQPVKVNLWFIPRPYFWHWIRLLISGTCLAFGFALSSQRSKFFIYLTSWSLLLAFSTDLIQVIRSTVSSNVNPGKSKRKDLYSAEKIQWALHNCNNTISVVVSPLVVESFFTLSKLIIDSSGPLDQVCLFYWIMVFPVVPPPKTDLSWADRILSHGVIASCVLLDLLLYNVRPFRKRHFYMPVIFGLGKLLTDA